MIDYFVIVALVESDLDPTGSTDYTLQQSVAVKMYHDLPIN